MTGTANQLDFGWRRLIILLLLLKKGVTKHLGKEIKTSCKYILVTTSRYKWIPLCVLAIIYGNFLLMVETIAFKNVGRSHSYPVEVQIALTLFHPGSASAQTQTRIPVPVRNQWVEILIIFVYS